MEADNPLSDEELRERIKRQIGGYPVSEADLEKTDDVVVRMPLDGSIVLTRDAAEKLSGVLDKKLARKRV